MSGKQGLLHRLEVAVLESGSADGRAKGLLRPWSWWERVSLRIWPIEYYGEHQTAGIRNVHYKGPERVLMDGTVVEPGDFLLELHLNNRRLMTLAASGVHGHWDAMRAIRSDLLSLAGAVAGGEFGDVVALRGVTLYTVPARWIGFELEPVPRTLHWRLNQFFMRGLARIYEPGNLRHSREARMGPWPHEVWLGRSACSSLASHGVKSEV